MINVNNEKIKLFKEKGFTYDSITGNVYSHKGKLLNSLNKEGYKKMAMKIDGKPINIRQHVFIWYLMNGDIPEGYMIDHINRNRTDNRLENLRLVTYRQNCLNSSRIQNAKGVYYMEKCTKNHWVAKIEYNGKNIYLGCYNSYEEAHQVYLEKAKILNKI